MRNKKKIVYKNYVEDPGIRGEGGEMEYICVLRGS
jgi:hypothetical protein